MDQQNNHYLLSDKFNGTHSVGINYISTSDTSVMNSNSLHHPYHGSIVTHHVHPSKTAFLPSPASAPILHSASKTLTAPVLPPNNLVSSAALPSSQALNSAEVFQNLKPRRGKWTKEEETYAYFLIKEFENGTVPDCENGSTLRAFLSRKLHCAPMRISKKFAGKSIGKYVFIARVSSTFTAIAYESRRKLVELEQAFLQAVMQEVRVPLPLLNVMQMNSSAPMPSSTTANSVVRFDVSNHINNLAPSSNTLTKTLASTSAYPENYAFTTLKKNQTSAAKSGSLGKDKSLTHPKAKAIKVDTANPPFVNLTQTTIDKNEVSRNMQLPNGVISMTDFLAGFEKGQQSNNNTANDEGSSCSSASSNECATTKSFDDFHQFLGKEISTPKKDNSIHRASTENSGTHSSTTLQQSDPTEDTDTLVASDQAIVEKNLNPQQNNTSKGNTISYDDFALFAQESAFAVSQHSAYSRIGAMGLKNSDKTITSNSDTYMSKSSLILHDDLSKKRTHNNEKEKNQRINTDPQTQTISKQNSITNSYDFNNYMLQNSAAVKGIGSTNDTFEDVYNSNEIPQLAMTNVNMDSMQMSYNPSTFMQMQRKRARPILSNNDSQKHLCIEAQHAASVMTTIDISHLRAPQDMINQNFSADANTNNRQFANQSFTDYKDNDDAEAMFFFDGESDLENNVSCDDLVASIGDNSQDIA